MTLPAPNGGRRRRLGRRIAAEEGMTLVEVLMSVFVLIVGLTGVFTSFGTSADQIAAAERNAAMVQLAQQELASAAALPYASIADSSTPAHSTSTTNPDYYVTTCSSTPCYQWSPSVSTDTETLDIDTTNGKVAPGPTTVVVPSPSGTACSSSATSTCNIVLSVYMFVTETTDSVCSQSGVTCTGYSYKRITVAVANAGTGAPKNPVYLSTFVGTKIGGTSNPLTSASTTCLDGTTTVSCTH